MSPDKLKELYDLLSHENGFDKNKLFRNSSVAVLYEDALKYENGSAITSSGALATFSGHKTGRSPKDKRIVDEPSSRGNVWWGPVNIPMDHHTFDVNRERAVDYLKIRDRIYIFDGYAGWHPSYRIKIRIICARAYHALFMNNMLIRPTDEELDNFGEPDFTVMNAGEFPANRYTTGMTSSTSVAIIFAKMEMIILGTQYAGEMKKGIFSVMHYLMPRVGVLSLHSSANESSTDPSDVTLFFGLSGTGKTTLSADPHRKLIGDDEHCWSDDGVFNIEGGCYAKCIDLNAEKEPEIFNAIRFGSVLENVVYNPITRVVDYSDSSVTENTRCAYPIEYIPNAKIPCIAGHPKTLIFLTCYAYGIEDGVTDPTVTFSACFGQPFLVWHPVKYAEMLAERMSKHSADAWLINTGWIGGAFGHGGRRIPLKYTRAIIDAIHAGILSSPSQEYEIYPVFKLNVPVSCPNVPSEILHPERAWTDQNVFNQKREMLAKLFNENFAIYEAQASVETRAAGPAL